MNDTATTEIYTLSLHDALPISLPSIKLRKCSSKIITSILSFISGRLATKSNQIKQRILVIILLLRSEERFSRNAETDIVCRLLLEKKKKVKEEIQDAVSTTLTY